MDISEKVKKILADQLNIEAADLTDDTTFDDLNADSLDVVEIIMALEEEFNLEIPDEEAERIKNVGDVVEYVISKVED